MYAFGDEGEGGAGHAGESVGERRQGRAGCISRSWDEYRLLEVLCMMVVSFVYYVGQVVNEHPPTSTLKRAVCSL